MNAWIEWIDWLTDWLIDWLIDWLVGLLNDWLIDWLVGWLLGCLVAWLIVIANQNSHLADSKTPVHQVYLRWFILLFTHWKWTWNNSTLPCYQQVHSRKVVETCTQRSTSKWLEWSRTFGAKICSWRREQGKRGRLLVRVLSFKYLSSGQVAQTVKENNLKSICLFLG